MRRWMAVGLLIGLGAGTRAEASVCSNRFIEALECDGSGWRYTMWASDPADFNAYNSCSTAVTQNGPDNIWAFDCPYTGDVQVMVANTECDLDVYVLAAGCNSVAGCISHGFATGSGAGVQELVTFACQAGQRRYIVVEGYALANTPGQCPWNNPATRNFRETEYFIAAFCDEDCTDGVDNDGDLEVDCADADCGCGEQCEIVGDEDNNGLADCADPVCAGLPACCDGDGDGALRAGGACGGTDCNDNNAQIRPGVADQPANGVDENCDGVDLCYVDADRDGIGGSSTAPGNDLTCGNAAGESSRNDDCRDSGANAATIYPGATDTPGDGVDQNCDGVDACFRDRDGDTWGAGAAQPGPGLSCAVAGWSTRGGDCLDAGAGAASSNPGAAEVCDGVDNDCDTLIDANDPNAQAAMTVFPDGDGDGYGVAQGQQTILTCAVPVGFAVFGGDCDDGDARRSPGLEEVPYDGIDQDCSGADLADIDGDGVAGPSRVGPDCNDLDPLVRPGRVELRNGVDDDCDGEVDEATDRADDDGDGFSELGGDCDDARDDVAPSRAEVCDGRDNDCDGAVDEGTRCADDDGDSWTEDDGDCNDGDAAVHPGAAEVLYNGIDDDCDGFTDGFGEVVDLDGDGFTAAAGDCDDTAPLVSPAAVEVVNGIDDDCDLRVDEGTPQYDDDGDGFTDFGGDCHDGDAAIHPGAVELWDGRDNDCNGRIDDVGVGLDVDRDGFTPLDGDCDDNARSTWPGAPEVANGVDDDCDGQIDNGLDDLDADGQTEAGGDCDDQNGWVGAGFEESCDGVDNDCDGASDEGCAIPATEGCGGCASTSPWGLSLAWPLLVLLRRRR